MPQSTEERCLGSATPSTTSIPRWVEERAPQWEILVRHWGRFTRLESHASWTLNHRVECVVVEPDFIEVVGDTTR